jgi:hypothetical protein
MLYCVGLAATRPGNELPISNLLDASQKPAGQCDVNVAHLFRGEVFGSKH